jgi:hypothetical protein
MRALLSLALGALAACALSACGDGDSEDDGDRAQSYALAVERISDDAYDAAQGGLVTLNRLSDGSVDAQAAIAALDRSSKEVTTDSDRLGELVPPEAGQETADDLAFQFDSLARSLGEAAATTSAATNGGGSLRDTGRSFARVVLAYQSGSAALSRSLRSIVVAAED